MCDDFVTLCTLQIHFFCVITETKYDRHDTKQTPLWYYSTPRDTFER